MRLAILHDGVSLPPWLDRAIAEAAAVHEIHMLARPGRRSGPQDALEWLRARRIDAIIAESPEPLLIPEGGPPIVSFRFGAPVANGEWPPDRRAVSGGEPFLRQEVVALTDRPGTAIVLAEAESRIHPHSRRATEREALELAPFLLARALEALEHGEGIERADPADAGTSPGRIEAARLIRTQAGALAKKLGYGAFVEKRWRVSLAASPGGGSPSERFARIDSDSAETLPTPPGYTFLADPMFHDDGAVLVEALEGRSGKGRLGMIRDGAFARLRSPVASHLSYPQTVEEGGHRYVVPEMTQAGETRIFAIEGDALRDAGALDIGRGPLIDPTFLRHAGRLYLFANSLADGWGVLRLWSAESLFDRFEEHPDSPVRVDMRGSRMGGGILRDGETLFRLGQDCARSYGDALLSFRIERLDSERYREVPAGRIALDGAKGPHTLDFRGEHAVFDWYEEKFAPLAWWRRLRGRIG